MKYFNIKRQLFFLAVTALFVTSCKKVLVPAPMGTAGQTLVQLVGGGTTASPGIVKLPIDFLPKPITLLAADLRRDIPNEIELSRIMHVVIKDDTTAVHTANPAYTILPSAWYTIGSTTPKTGGSGGAFNITIPAGETSMPIFITIPDATVLDPSTLYGLGFTITSVDASGKISTTNTTVIEVGAKNKYDGRYALRVFQSGWAAYGIADGVSNTYPGDMLLITTGAAVNNVFNDYTGTFLLAAFSATGATQFGATTPVYTFDPSTDKLIAVTNSTPDDGRGRTLNLDPAITNSRFDAATKTIYAAFYMTQNGRPNQYFRDTLTYKGGR